VNLLIAEADDSRPDPLTLVRLSLQGTANPLSKVDTETVRVKNLYLTGFPGVEKLFSRGDFNLWKISPKEGRFVAGFGRALNITPERLKKVSAILPGLHNPGRFHLQGAYRLNRPGWGS